MKRILAIANQKGGVGKTTTAINLGAALAELGRRVLLVDLDPQGTLSIGLGLRPHELHLTVYDVLRDNRVGLKDVIVQTGVGCDLAPSNIDLAGAEVELVSEPGREQILKEKLAALHADYDDILIDCPPSLGLLTLNALTAATDVLIPVQSQYFALRGMQLLFRTIEKVRQRLNPGLRVAGVLATMFDGRTLHSREVLNELRETYGEDLFDVVIKYTIKFADAPLAGQSVLGFSGASEAARAYRDLAQEVVRGN